MKSLIFSIDKASSKSLAVIGSIVKILLSLKSTLLSISSFGMIHSPDYWSMSFVNILKLSSTLSLIFYPCVSYSSDHISCIFRILKLSASKLPASPIDEITSQTGLIANVLHATNLTM